MTPRTVNRQVATLHAMSQWAFRTERIGTNPIKGIDKLPHDDPAKQRRPLSAEEALAILEHSPAYLRPVWRAYLVTGMRRDEIVNLKFIDIDSDRRVATVRAGTSKTHQAREVPLDDEMLAAVIQLRDEAKHRQPVNGRTRKQTEQQRANFSREHVFVTGADTPWKNNLLERFYACCQKACIEGAHRNGSVDIHALRGSFITLAIDGGGSPKAVQSVVGHATFQQTMDVYAKSTERGKREAIDALPFAKVSAPDHVIPMQKLHANYTENSNETQVVSM